MDISHYLVLMTSKDPSAIRHWIEGVAWFKENICKSELKEYATAGFIVLESEAVEDEICTLVSLNEEPYVTVRCDFTMVLSNACLVNLRKSLDDTGMRCWGSNDERQLRDRDA